MPQLIVRPDNVSFNDYRSKPKVIRATSGQELFDMIRDHYGITPQQLNSTVSIEVWSKPIGMPRIRLDSMENIPSYYDEAWVRLVARQQSPSPSPSPSAIS